MKTKLVLTLLGICLMLSITAQAPSGSTLSTIEPKQSPEEQKAIQHFLLHHPNPSLADYNEFINSRRKEFGSSLSSPPSQKLAQPSTPMASCTNIDFEQGTLAGWTATNGYHPLYNATGCCPTAGGAQAIVTGAGTDACGGFPVVAPGGTFSVKLGNNGIGGIADRLEQTFQVSSANTNFSYAYAVVLQDPGHATADQPSFQIEMLDGNGNQIPCTFYQVSAGQGIPGFINSTNCPGVIYKPWTTVSVDLSTYVGQNVTIRFTTYDCALGGHYGYAYIDGSCNTFKIHQNGVLCNNSPAILCAPPGYATYTWNGPGITNVSGQCLVVNSAGVYDVQLTSITGCSSPLIDYTVTMNPAPNANFSPSNLNGCNAFLSFNNTSSNGGGAYTSYWTFGDGDTSTQVSPTHTYPAYGTYTVTLYVYAQNGCSDTTSQVVVINPPPAPGMSYTATCEGIPVQFAGSINGNQQSATWYWDFGNGNTSTLQNPTYTFPSWGSFPVSLSVTDNGCTTTVTQNVSIQPNPVISIIPNTVCLGNATSFFNNSSIPIGSIATWAWDFNGDGITDNTSQSPAYTFANPGTHTVTLTATSSNGCVGSGSASVIVYALPTAAFTTQNNCFSAPSVFTNASTAPLGATITQYYWDFGDGTFSILQQPTHTYATPATYQVRLDVTTNQSCTNTVIKPLSIYPLPLVNFTATSLCENQTAQFSGTVNGGTNASQWSWNFGGGSTSTLQNPVHTFGNAGTYPVTLTATDNNGCINTITQNITTQPVPVIAVFANSVCQGLATTFTNNSSIPSGSIANWNWDFTADGTIDNTNAVPTHTYPASGTYSVIVSASSNFGCVSSQTFQVNVYALPVANFSANNTCENLPTVFTNNSTAPNGAYLSQYAWTFGNGVNSTTQQPQYTYPAAGTYQVYLTVTTNQGCSSGTGSSITIYPAPNANFTVNPACANQNMPYTNQSTISSGILSSYNWDFNGDGVVDAGSINPIHTYAAGGSYNTELLVVSNFGCRDSVTKPVTVYHNPVANFQVNSVCLGNSVQFNDLSSSQSGNITVWDWDFTSDNVYDNFSQNPSHLYTTAGQILVTLQVQTNFGCVNVIKKPLNVNPTPVPNFSVTKQNGCEGDMCVGMINNSTITGGSMGSWQWNFGDGYASYQNSPIHCFNHAGNFTVTLTAVSDSGCSAKYTLPGALVVFPRPQAGFDFTNNNLDELDAATGVVSTAVGANGYVYFISDGTVINNQPNFQHAFSNESPQQYTVVQVVTNSHGCKDTLIKSIDVKPGFTFYIPNAFSPNGDGMNDIFKGTGIGVKEFSLMIYDRWGNLVFISDDLERGWDGTFKSEEVTLQDVFVWKVALRDVSNRPHDYSGTVSLVK